MAEEKVVEVVEQENAEQKPPAPRGERRPHKDAKG